MSGLRSLALAGTVCLTLALCGTDAAGAAPVSSGHSGWSWALPTPQGQTLSAVAFDGATGYAVGDFGTVMKSADGGQTWSGLPSGTTANLSILQELDPNTVIVGGGCALRESTNGGQTFSAVPINPSDSVCGSDIAAISFQSASTGYVELQSGQILYTTNAGVSVQAKTNVPTSFGHATGLTFVSPTTGFATTSAGTIEQTSDGGNSWTQIGTGFFALNAITFINPQTAFAVGDDTLLQSTNGGATWSRQPLTIAGGDVYELTGISCASAAQCLITTSNSNSLILTNDGGQTGSLVTPSDQHLSAVAFTTGTGVVGVGTGGTIVLSADGGAHFPTLVSGGPGVPTSSSTERPLLAGGAAGSAYLLGTGGQIDATTNGGANWTLLQTPSNDAVKAGAFPTTSIGYVTTSDNILRKTTDGGIAWSSLDATVSAKTQLAAPTASSVLLVGPRGIRRSSNGGSTFVKVAGRVQLADGRHGAAISSLPLTDAAVHGSTTFVWGFHHAYESTNPSGASWRLIPLPRKTRINQLSFVSPTTGYALDVAGDVLFTSDRGATWRKLANVGTTTLADISFADATHGLLALGPPSPTGIGLQLDVLSTTNGGASWQPQVIDGRGAGRVLATANAGYFANVGVVESSPYRSVFTTTDGGASPNPSQLTLSLGAKQLTAKALRKRGGRETIRGRLTPVTSPGERVLLSYRSRQTGEWTSRTVAVASNGAFQATVSMLKATTDFVVDSTGDGTYGGAQGYARLTVR
jgi:photosystem II stability/assembly factor-like uncharacterized protein